ncbi:MAG: hypothetical protein B7Y39_04170 [Bdellovibrio sp. 28-41-41]|nr:MAG: hypothetical protein B7Y39_04170 [Bdellovibrio sp. 28-41-41]
MRNTKSLAIIVVLFMVIPVFAEDTKLQDPKLAEFQVKQAINLLLNSGLLNPYENNVLIGRLSILEELRLTGRVQTLSASPSSICFKPK